MIASRVTFARRPRRGGDRRRGRREEHATANELSARKDKWSASARSTPSASGSASSSPTAAGPPPRRVKGAPEVLLRLLAEPGAAPKRSGRRGVGRAREARADGGAARERSRPAPRRGAGAAGPGRAHRHAARGGPGERRGGAPRRHPDDHDHRRPSAHRGPRRRRDRGRDAGRPARRVTGGDWTLVAGGLRDTVASTSSRASRPEQKLPCALFQSRARSSR